MIHRPKLKARARFFGGFRTAPCQDPSEVHRNRQQERRSGGRFPAELLLRVTAVREQVSGTPAGGQIRSARRRAATRGAATRALVASAAPGPARVVVWSGPVAGLASSPWFFGKMHSLPCGISFPVSSRGGVWPNGSPNQSAILGEKKTVREGRCLVQGGACP